MIRLHLRRRRFGAIATLVLAIAVVAPMGTVLAATSVPLHEPHEGTVADCGDRDILWHFVLNQLDPETPSGTVTASFDPGGEPSDVGESVGIGRVQHFWIATPSGHTLLGASATVADQEGSPKLVLSHWECGEATPNTPPSNPPSNPPLNPPEGGLGGGSGTIPPRESTAASTGGPSTAPSGGVKALPDTAMPVSSMALALAVILIVSGAGVVAVAVRHDGLER